VCASLLAVLGNRPFDLVRRNVVRKENYAAVRRMWSICERPREIAWRYLSGRGAYPYRCELRTPLGRVAPVVYSHDDLVTVVEVFCRLDYAAPPNLRFVVDIGSNIGISALYFLTRNPHARCHLYEPVPRNVERLRENLAGFEERYELTEAAVWDRAGTVTFGVEPTGRYGGIDIPAPETIEVPCAEINDVLEHAPRVDVLKVDTEGAELATVAAIRPELQDRVRVIYLETLERTALHPERFDTSFSCDTLRLTQRRESYARSTVSTDRASESRSAFASNHADVEERSAGPAS
jgi:FkbM family methyltransferase